MRRVDVRPGGAEVWNVSDQNTPWTQDSMDLAYQGGKIADVLKHLVGVDGVELFVPERKAGAEIGDHIYTWDS